MPAAYCQTFGLLIKTQWARSCYCRCLKASFVIWGYIQRRGDPTSFGSEEVGRISGHQGKYGRGKGRGNDDPGYERDSEHGGRTGGRSGLQIFLFYKTAREQNLNEKELQKSKCKEYKWEEIITEKGRKQGYMRESWILSNWKTKWSTGRNVRREKDTCSDKIEK